MAPLTHYTPVFEYGSNLWLKQLDGICPDNVYSCIAKLDGWKWIINTKGFTTIIPSPNDYVWGIVVLIHTHDEQKLDDSEGPDYLKTIFPVQTVGMKLKTDLGVLVYIDNKHTTTGHPEPSYVSKLQKAMKDGREKGIPQSYFDTYWKPFLTSPSVGSETAEAELEE